MCFVALGSILCSYYSYSSVGQKEAVKHARAQGMSTFKNTDNIDIVPISLQYWTKGLRPTKCLRGPYLLERCGESSAGEKVRIFGKGRTCRRQKGRSSRQASDTGVVHVEGSPILKSAISDNFGRVTVKVRQLKASAIGSFGRWLLLRKSVFLCQGRRRVCLGVSCFDPGYARLIMV
ncbi:hypothetical protein L3X38_024144 [Prunus dulcis]|uniref:Uncharacterized protein n=1 Tax=Prunus dulcis TaxID=3755 RepID=A0AAD4Z651_PRUDU|nr:hypothetical protein L3X38_024144 [Prunus dulcis]